MQATYEIRKWKDGRNFAVYADGELLAVTVYKKGAERVVKELSARDQKLGVMLPLPTLGASLGG